MQKHVWESVRPGAVPDAQPGAAPKDRPCAHPLLLSRGAQPPLHSGAARVTVPSFDPKTIHYDSEKMLATELAGAVRTAAGGMQAAPSVRANMGCGIFPTLFGIEQVLFEDKMPWVQRHLSKEALQKMGPEDLKLSDEFKAGLEHMDYMTDKLEGSGCGVYPMDLQGPFDTAHLVYGDAIFYDLYDDPEFVHHLLELSCEAIFMGMDECLKHIRGADAGIFHYNNLAMPRSIGGIKTSEDTSTLLSGDHVREFVVPYTTKVLERYGGGYIHYCGRNDHLYREVMDMPLAYGINFGNPDKHNMTNVLRDCARADKIYYGSIPEREGETVAGYFKRCVSDAYLDGKIHLLLTYTRADGKGEKYAENSESRAPAGGADLASATDGAGYVKEAWEAACASVFK
jgi:hypothetical protein